MFLEQHRFKLERERQRIVDRRERTELEATIEANRLSINDEKVKLDEMITGPNSTQANIDRLRTREAELAAELEKCRAKIALEEQKLANLSQAIEEQKSKLKKSIKHISSLSKTMKVIPGTDAQAIDEIEQIRQCAVSAIHKLVSG